MDQWGVVTNPATNEKIGCGGMDELFPVIAVVDPELMLTVPPKFTAYQGFDALFHSVEGYLSVVSSPMSEMVQLAAIENIGTYLAARGKGRQRSGGQGACGICQYDVRLLDGGRFLHKRTFDGTCDERISSGAAARCGTDYDFGGVLQTLYRKTLL